MSGGYLDRLVARATGGPGLLRPRLPSLFEPVDPAGGPAGWAWQASPDAPADPPPPRPIPAPEWTEPAAPAELGPDLAAVANLPAMVPDPAPGRGRRRLASAGPADEPAPPAEPARQPDGPLVAGDSSGALPGPVSGRPALAGPPAEPPATAPAEERSSGVLRPPIRPARAGSERLQGAASDRVEATVGPATTALPAPSALPTVPTAAAAPSPGRREARPGPVAEGRPSGPAWRVPPSPPPAAGRAPSPPPAAGFETGGPAVPAILPASPADGSAEPVIHVTIGRIEVRAVQAEQPPAPRRPSPASGPSLERYLRERSKRRR